MEQNDITWSAPEHDLRKHSADWYWIVSIITGSVAIALFIVGNMLLSIIILLGVGILMFRTTQEPTLLNYRISVRGVHADKRVYDWDSLESFWIINEQTTHNHYISPKLLLISSDKLSPQIVIPLHGAPANTIRRILQSKLEEIPQHEPLPDRIMRALGF